MNSPPAPLAGFAARLEHLLAEVPVRPGSTQRFTTDDLVRALAAVVDSDDRAESLRVARWWLRAARREAQAPLLQRDRPALQVLADLFRVPVDYFLDQARTDEFDERMNLAAQARERGIEILGPCRGLVGDREAFKIYRSSMAALATHGTGTTN